MEVWTSTASPPPVVAGRWTLHTSVAVRHSGGASAYHCEPALDWPQRAACMASLTGPRDTAPTHSERAPGATRPRVAPQARRVPLSLSLAREWTPPSAYDCVSHAPQARSASTARQRGVRRASGHSRRHARDTMPHRARAVSSLAPSGAPLRTGSKRPLDMAAQVQAWRACKQRGKRATS